MSNIVFKDAGRTEKDYSSEVVSGKSSKIKTVYSSITVDAKSFPSLHEKEVGEKCRIIVEVRKTGESLPDKWETDKNNKITLEVLKIGEPKDVYEDLIEKNS